MLIARGYLSASSYVSTLTNASLANIIHKLRMPYVGDELHHAGWNICSSCPDSKLKRDTFVLPCLMSDRVYFIDTSNARAPTIKKVLEPEEMHKHGLATPHTAHCSPTGEIIISTMGKPNGDGLGDFLCVDSETLQVKGPWTLSDKKAKFGYDFWYQPSHDVLISTEWGVPRIFKKGFGPGQSSNPDIYGRNLNFYSWTKRSLEQVIDLGEEGIAPLEVRFLHDPLASEGFVGCAVSSNIFRFYKTDNDRKKPRLVGQVFLGGSILSDSKIQVIEDQELSSQPDPVVVKGRRLYGSPQMLQLSLDGRRLYVTTSIFKPWDKQFYPDHVKNGSTMVKLDVDVENGGLKLDPDFLVDFGEEKDDILLAHEMRYPGGDCTSDIWLANP
ncbi:hypothetical protein G9C98_000046 [Cotesia typhae]|uniref:Selenium-binding protein 1 n=1 Tax=Cotesia typhae TaxID=2053667 RepID=A0A8J5RB79_9HYME|nr:hypothetical protein G9C98_000046 [Cotesia typhae]